MAQNLEEMISESSMGHSSFARRHRVGSSRRHTTRAGWVLLAPSLTFIGVFIAIPIVYVIYLSLYRWCERVPNSLEHHPS